ncbi:uncharacterized protein PAC_00934 [Phialocephala subalpina]|uniref:Uncharacterized protein n=1 Tax=Phialocephala subalpina TaxID=576137 RepID=A0A1L7WEB0_9HELO|nr:uncharacterized protein PAC_00934 [Phialocephala subalpina]
MAAQPQGVDLRTPFAKKYGVSQVAQLSQLRKSGFTPTLPVNEYNSRLERHQRTYLLHGFTARELVDLGAYPDPNAKLTDLQSDPHELFDRKNWVKPGNRDRIPILPIIASGDEYSLGPTPGYWHAENPAVWSILTPILKLASRYISNIHTNQLIDDYFFGDFRQLSPEKYKRNPTDQPRFSFHARKAQERNAEQTQVALQKTANLLRSYNFSHGFGHHTKELYTGQPSNSMAWSGVTFPHRNGSIKISLSTDRYQPLLRNDLSASERYAHEVYNAKVLVHEFMHALHYTMSFSNLPAHSRYRMPEPWWESQVISELGFALDTSIHEGSLLTFVNDGRFKPGDNRGDYPRLGIWLISFPPSDFYQISWNALLLDNAKRPDFDTLRPIPSKFYENMKSDEFWDVIVRKYGNEAAKPNAIVHVVENGNVKAPPSFTKPVSSGRLPIWETADITREIESFDGPRTDAIRTLLSSTPHELREKKLKLQLRLNDARLQERAAFRNGQSSFMNDSRILWMGVSSSVSIDDRKTALGKMNDLIKCLREEAERLSKEIARFVLGNDQDKFHRLYLQERNWNMRNMARNFNRDFAEKTQDSELTGVINDLIERHDVCLMMLYEKNITPNLPQAKFYEQTKEKMTPARVKSLIDLQPFAGRADTPERKQLLADAAQAIVNQNATKCGSYADLFLEYLADKPFFCAVAQILMSYDGKPEHRNLIEYIDAPERNSFLQRDFSICSDETRNDWYTVYQARIAELKDQRNSRTWSQVVSCAARSDNDDRTIAALKNKIHWAQYRR